MVLFIIDDNNIKHARLCESITKNIKSDFLILTSWDLVYECKVDIKIKNESENFSLRFRNRIVESEEITYSLCLISCVPLYIFSKFTKRDQSYVSQEWNAILLSMMHILGAKNLLNHPKPLGLNGDHVGVEEFYSTAMKNNIPVKNFFSSHLGQTGIFPKSDRSGVFSITVYEGFCFANEMILNLVPNYFKNQLIDYSLNLKFRYVQYLLEVDSKGLFVKSINTTMDSESISSKLINYLTEKINVNYGNTMWASN
jgi:hypothetical protein